MTTAKEQGELDLSRSAQSGFARVHPHDTGFASADISVTVRQARIEEDRPAGAEQIGAAIDGELQIARDDIAHFLARVRAMADAQLVDMRKIHPGCAITFEQLYDYPCHRVAPEAPALKKMIALSGSNRLAKVAYGTEAGLLQNGLGVPTVICGPGDIAVAHKPDEFVTLEQLRRCETLLKRLCADY